MKGERIMYKLTDRCVRLREEAVEKMGIPKKHIAAVGDQIFTDVLGAGLFGVKMLYVDPIEHEKTTFFKVKRKCEKPFLPRKYYNEQERKQ